MTNSGSGIPLIEIMEDVDNEVLSSD